MILIKDYKSRHPYLTDTDSILKQKKLPHFNEAAFAFLVGTTGFEPATSRPPDVYANRTALRPEHLKDCKYKVTYPFYIYLAPKLRNVDETFN